MFLIIRNDEQPKTSTGNAVACPIAIPFSTYAAGRDATMTEAQLRPLLTKEQDILAQSLSPIAPTTASISVGAQQQIILLPTTSSISQLMVEGPNPILIYGMTTPQATLTQELLARTIQGVIMAPHTLTTPAEPPIRPIPPKPPYLEEVISPIISVTPAEPSDTLFRFMPPDHDVCERERWPQNQQGKSNGPHHMPDISNLAMVATLINTKRAPSEA